MSLRVWLAFVALLLPSPVAAGCVLFKELVELDEKAGRYLRASPSELSDRRAALTIAVAVVDHMLDGFDSGGLAEFLGVRRHLAWSDVSGLSDITHEEFLVRLHRTRRDLPRYGEAWGCLSRSENAYSAGQPGGVSSAPKSSVMRSQDQHRTRPQTGRSGAVAPAAPNYFSGLWLFLGGGVVVFWLLRWEARRTFMRQRHVCNVLCIVEANSKRIEASIADLSMVGAKVKIADDAMLHTARGKSHIVFNERRIAFDITWRTAHFMGIRFKKPISRKLVTRLSSGLQHRAGAGERRKVQSARQPPLHGRPAREPVTGSAQVE